jgi:hypothetical protein
MKTDIAPLSEVRFWDEIGSRVDDNADKASYFDVTAQQPAHHLIHNQSPECERGAN